MKTTSGNETNMGTLKHAAAVVVGIAIFAGVFYHSCLRVTNEIGPIGADKVGRQIMLQTFDAEIPKDRFRITSEWDDSSFLGRFFIQEPMRTTFRFVTMPPNEPDPERLNEMLSQPYSEILSLYEGKISLSDKYEMSAEDLDKELKELGASSVEDYLAAWGFRRMEIVHDGRIMAGRELKTIGRPNVKWVGDAGK